MSTELGRLTDARFEFIRRAIKSGPDWNDSRDYKEWIERPALRALKQIEVELDELRAARLRAFEAGKGMFEVET